MSDSNNRRVFLKSMAATGLAAGAGTAHASKDVPLHPSDLGLTGKGYINPRKVLLYECTRREIRERLAAGKLKAALVPTGSTEQHNEHLAMIMDSAGALVTCQQAALQIYPKAIVTTPVSIGISPHWMNRRGTLSLKKETFVNVVFDICESLKGHGINTILIVNGHGGNVKPLNEEIANFREKLGINIDNCSYWDSIDKELGNKLMETKRWPDHASEFETSIALAAFPERVRYRGIDPNYWDHADYDGKDATAWDKKTFGESKVASAEKGEQIITHASTWLAQKLLGMIG